MTPEQKRRLEEFVDREEEMERFGDFLETEDKFIVTVWGSGGIGKSSLLARMIHECAYRKLRKSEVVWTNTRNHDYLGIMRKIRDDVGVDYFQPFTDLVNFFTVPQYELKIKIEKTSAVTVANGAQIEGSSVGDIAGIVIKDSMIVAPRTDMAVPEIERMARLTDRFMENLATALPSEPLLVIFFDAVEKMTTDTHQWVWSELLKNVRENCLRNVKFVLCGRQEFQLDRDTQLFVEEIRLQPLNVVDVVNYLAKRGINNGEVRYNLALMLLHLTKGDPLQMATAVDGFLRLQKKTSLPK
jgi:GTPase SAR1 family protein